MEKSKGGENYPKINSFPRSGKHFISLMSETWEYELFISINFQQHEIYKVHPSSFEGESSKNVKEEFMVSIKDVICIIMSDMILYINQRGQLSYCRSRRYII